MKFLPLLFMAEALLLQWLGGAYASGFGGHPDEAAHFVSAVMVHDFLADAGAGVSPLAFAQQFYLHYPKVAIGNWPPLLHVLLALWFLLCGVSRASALALVALLAAATATLMAAAARRLLSPAAGVFAGVVYLALPLVQESTALVMTEHLVTLLILASTLAFARFALRPGTGNALLFGALAAAAILTRGSAWALALLPPLAIALSGRWQLLRDGRLWLAALLVCGLCVPWYVATRGMSPHAMVGLDPGAPAAFFLHAASWFPLAALHAVGPPLALLAALGAWRQWRRGRTQPECVAWSALAAMAAGILLIQCIVPAGLEARYMLQLLPALVLFAAAGLRRMSAFAWSVASVAILLTVFHLPSTLRNRGYDAIATDLAGQPATAVLLISDARGEGSMVAAIALRERRPRTLVLRGSKLLVSEDWLGRNSQPRFASVDALRAMLDAIPVNAILIDRAIEPQQARSYHRQLAALIEADPQHWQRHASYNITRYGEQAGQAALYQRRNSPGRAREVDLAYLRQLMLR